MEAVSRSETGYRLYDRDAVQKLIFIRRSRAFGFSIEECRKLLALYEERNRTSVEIKRIACKKLEEIEIKQAELQSLHDALAHLVASCHGDTRPECPIIDFLGWTKNLEKKFFGRVNYKPSSKADIPFVSVEWPLWAERYVSLSEQALRR